MKGKRYTTEEKIRILREADKGKAITEVCREHNLSQVTFHRWKKQFGQMEVNEAKRLKELERENTELKKMLADSLLKNRVLEAVCEKKLLAQGIGGKWPGAWSKPGCVLGVRCAGYWAWPHRPFGIEAVDRAKNKGSCFKG